VKQCSTIQGGSPVRIGYEELLAHRLQAGADLLLHPSRFEPCGLTPLYAMRYGTLSIVRHVGGLSDTIVDATEWTVRAGSATGFAFRDPNASAMLECLDRALAFYSQQARWRKMQQRAMSREFGWDGSARRYAALYGKLAPDAGPVPITLGQLDSSKAKHIALAPVAASKRARADGFGRAGQQPAPAMAAVVNGA
jgi:glycogen synthase